MLPKIIQGAIENVYQTPFRLLGKFGKKQLQKLKKHSITLNKHLIIIIFTWNQTKITVNIYNSNKLITKKSKYFFCSLILLNNYCMRYVLLARPTIFGMSTSNAQNKQIHRA